MVAPRGAVLVILLSAAGAHAGPRSIAIAAGDCRDVELLNGATAFSEAVSGLLKTDAVDSAVLLERLRPRPSAGLDDVQRQLDGAQSQFYSGQLDPAVAVVRSAQKTLERLPPSDAVGKQLVAARVLEGLIYKALGKKTEQTDAWTRVLRIAPDFKMDPDFQTPAAIAQFDALKKELAGRKKVALAVGSTPPGAIVFVDGTRAGKTPFKGAYLPGEYKVTITNGETQSFVYDARLEVKPVELAIDLGFEGSVRGQLPLCVSTSEPDALKLAGRAAAEQALVLRVDSRNGEPGWVSAVLYDVAKGTRVREGGMKVAAAKLPGGYADLASFVLTGQPAKLALSGSKPAEPQPAPPAAVADAAKPAAPAPVEPAPAQPAPAETAASSGGGGVPRFIPLAIAGAGVVVAGAGVIYYATGDGDRRALVGHVDQNGNVINPKEAQQVADLDADIAANRNTSIALGITGLAVAAVGGVLFFALAPKDAPQPTALVTPNGVYAGVTGSF